MSEAPLVAVLTPVYNGERFIADAIACVQAQTWRPLVHVILDNASTDATPEIIAAAGGSAPIISRRNPALLPVAANFNAVVELTPPEADYFTVLCADDGMAPTAIEEMVALARSAPDVRMVSGAERRNGAPVASRISPEAAIYPAAAILARIIEDRARIPYHHVLYRADLRRAGERFFDEEVVGFDADTVYGLLACGGQFGFVQRPIFETAVHESSLSSTWVHATAADAWEDFARVAKFGPAVLSNVQLAKALRERRGSLLRKMIWRAATGKGALARRDHARLKALGAAPGALDFAVAVAAWPAHRLALNARARYPRPWPAGAVRPFSADRA